MSYGFSTLIIDLSSLQFFFFLQFYEYTPFSLINKFIHLLLKYWIGQFELVCFSSRRGSPFTMEILIMNRSSLRRRKSMESLREEKFTYFTDQKRWYSLVHCRRSPANSRPKQKTKTQKRKGKRKKNRDRSWKLNLGALYEIRVVFREPVGFNSKPIPQPLMLQVVNHSN